MIILAIDTCMAACSAALLDDDRVLAAQSEPMSRGHQERLAPMVGALMARAGIGFGKVARVGVTVGPGSFTGLRVGLAFAKGLGAALDIPVIGLGVLEVLAAPYAATGTTVFPVLEAKRDQVYLQAFAKGAPLMAPDGLEISVAMARVVELAGSGPVILVGTGTAAMSGAAPGARLILADHVDPVDLARLAAGKPAIAPRPLYLRAPDAKLPGGKDLHA